MGNPSLRLSEVLTYLRKSVFWSAFGFSNIAFIIPSQFIIVPYFTLWINAGFFQYKMSYSLDPDQARLFVGPDLGPNCLQRLSADIVDTKQLVDTFWLKPWLKFISFGSNFFHLAKLLAYYKFWARVSPGHAICACLKWLLLMVWCQLRKSLYSCINGLVWFNSMTDALTLTY